MGLLDLLSAKIENKMLKAKMEKNSLKALESLTQSLSEYQQRQGQESRGAMELAPGSEDPNIINPEIQPVKANPQRLMDALFPVIAQSNPAAAGQLFETMNDPKRKLLESVVSLITGMGKTASSGQPGGMVAPQTDPLTGIIKDMTGEDQNAAASAAGTGTALEMAGVPIFKGVERIQTGQTRQLAQKKYDDEIKAGITETYKDPTGAEYTRYVNKVTKEPITGPGTDPGGWRKSAAAKLEAVDVTVPGKGKVRVWVTPGREGGIATGPEPLKEVTEELPGGGQRRRTIPESQSFDVTTKQPAGSVAIQGDELGLWVHPATLATATQGMTPDQAKAEGFQRVSTAAKQSIDSLKAATVVVTEIKGLMNKVFPEKESFASPQRALRPIGAALQTNPDATRLFSLVNGTLAPIVRSLGEKGNLSDTDVKRAGKLMILGTDSTKVARDKTNGLLNLLGKIQRSTFSGTGTAPAQKDLGTLSNEELLKELEK
jgi:hypothetical protein